MLYYRVWNDILPKLEPILRRTEEKRLSEELDNHVKSQFWRHVQLALLTDGVALPHWPDARKLPSISKVLKRHQENLVQNWTIWPSIFANALVESKQYILSVKKDLVKLLERASPSSYPRGESFDDILNRASSVFQCVPEGPPSYNHTRNCQGVYGYPDILQHLLWCNFSDPWDRDLVRCDRETAKIAELVLKNLNMPIDTPRSTTNARKGKFMCLCGHPNHMEGTSFEELVSNMIFLNIDWFYDKCLILQIHHVAKENVWYDKLKVLERA
jgi:hypothetical protein